MELKKSVLWKLKCGPGELRYENTRSWITGQ